MYSIVTILEQDWLVAFEYVSETVLSAFLGHQAEITIVLLLDICALPHPALIRALTIVQCVWQQKAQPTRMCEAHKCDKLWLRDCST